MNRIWSLRPQGTSAKNWSPGLTGAAVITFEWIAQGLTVVSFWTALRRSITALEDRLRCQGHGPITLAGPIESE